MKFWDHSEDLWEREIRERLRLGNKFDDQKNLPDPRWLEQWTTKLMSTIENIEKSQNIKKHCRTKYLE
jgi:hypothetical protein